MKETLTSQLDTARQFISSAKRVLLATHENPDGDGLAAMLAFNFWLKELGKESTLFVKEELPPHLKFLPGIEHIKKEIPEGEEYDLLAGFDYGDLKRLGLDEWLARRPQVKILVFDHHPESRQKGDLQIIDAAAP